MTLIGMKKHRSEGGDGRLKGNQVTLQVRARIGWYFFQPANMAIKGIRSKEIMQKFKNNLKSYAELQFNGTNHKFFRNKVRNLFNRQ